MPIYDLIGRVKENLHRHHEGFQAAQGGSEVQVVPVDEFLQRLYRQAESEEVGGLILRDRYSNDYCHKHQHCDEA